MKARNQTILFFDGNCALCHRSVRYLIHTDTSKRLYFAPLQGLTAQAILAPEERQSLQTVIYRRGAADGSVIHWLRSDAVLLALIDTGSNWRYLARLLHYLPRRMRDWCYDRIANKRHKILRTEACPFPSTAAHMRILP